MRTRYFLTVYCTILTFGLGLFSLSSCRLTASEVSAYDGFDTPVLEPVSLVAAEELSLEQGLPVLKTDEGEDTILSSYRNPLLSEGVVAFFRDLTGSQDLAEVVLSNAAAYNIPAAMAFALCWEESRYDPRAYNRNRNDTVDRGLFQLNSATFPNLKVDDFYNPGTNARYGLSHLRWCLDNAGTEVAGLAMYNAGHTRVRTNGTPKTTLDYISRILKRQRSIEDLFAEQFQAYYAPVVTKEDNEKEVKVLLRLSLLTPLGR